MDKYRFVVQARVMAENRVGYGIYDIDTGVWIGGLYSFYYQCNLHACHLNDTGFNDLTINERINYKSWLPTLPGFARSKMHRVRANCLYDHLNFATTAPFKQKLQP